MAITIQIKRDTASNWTSNATTLAAGEFGFETDTGKFKVGDGSTAWASLDYFEPEAGAAYVFGGTTSGYNATGQNPGVPTAPSTIEKYSYASDANSTDVGDSSVAGSGLAGTSSKANGYNAGSTGDGNRIEKFPFASDANATDVGNLTTVRSYGTGTHSETDGYHMGGGNANVIDKFPFSSDANATDVGDLTYTRQNGAGQASDSNGYHTGGYYAPAPSYGKVNYMEKFPFSSDGNTSDIGDLTNISGSGTGHSSDSNGYHAGGEAPGNLNIINKFPFSSDANATDAGDLTVARGGLTGSSSTGYGYSAGGEDNPPTPNFSNVIDKYTFASDANATDVGDLLNEIRNGRAGHQI
jgi:hypothetical protein